MPEKATLRIQFNLNQGTGASSKTVARQKAYANFASVIVRNVGLRMAEKEYRKLRRQVAFEIERDVHQEIENIARLYTRHVVGRSGARNRTVELKALTTETSGAGSFGTWSPLSPDTVRRKGHARFFENRREMGTEMRSGAFWERSFGPVSVTVRRTISNAPPIANVYRDTRSRLANFSVATIKVSALTGITSAMLPELLSNRLGYSPDGNGRSAGLVNMLASSSARLKVGGWNRSGQGAYRPTLEPFLAFVLTRAIPQAVLRRVTNRNEDYANKALRIRL